MEIWVDADACPRAIREILFRAAERVRVRVTLVANRVFRVPPSRFIRTLRVPDGFDVADRRIVELTQPGDLVITADIPLAAEIVDKGGHALNPRGELYTKENIGECLATRNLLDELRDLGKEIGGPSPFTRTDRLAFANRLDRLLARRANAGRDREESEG